MKKRMLSILFAIVMAVALVPGVTLTASAESETHEHSSHDNWTAITKLSEITSPGNYYITEGFVFDRTISANGTVNLCLNGQSVSYSYATTITSGTTVNICDCSASEIGTFGCEVKNSGTLNLYGGKIGGRIENYADATLNIYGGSVEYSKNHVVTNNGTMAVYGGSVTASGDYGYAVENNASLLINNGTFESKGNVCIDNDSKDATIKGGTFYTNGSNSVIRNNGGAQMEISGGTFTSKGTNQGTVLSVSTGSELIVKGGTFTSGGTVISNLGAITITAGDFKSTTTATNRYVLSATKDAVTNISGGVFTHKDKNVSLYVYRSTGEAVPVSLSGGTFKNGIQVTYYRDNGYGAAYLTDLLADGYTYYQNNDVLILDSPYKSSITGGDVSVAKEPDVEIYTITFDANEGTVSTASAQTNLKCQLESLPTPYRNNYVFKGWFTAKENGTKITVETKFTSSQTVYAQWEPKTYTITYVLYDNATETDTYTYGEDVELPKPVERDGYRFRGWYKDAAYTDGPYGKIIQSSVNFKFYAKWEKEYAVTIPTLENGSVSADISDAVENETVTLTITPDAGYALASVSVKDANDAEVPLSGEGNTRTFKMPAGDVTVTAVFEQAKVSFNSNGGTGTMDAVTVTGATYTLPECGFTAPATTVPGGMVFAGWAYSTDGDVITGEAITVNGNVELFAIWKYTPDLNQTIEKSGVFDKEHTFDIDLGVLIPSDAKITSGVSVSASGSAVANTSPTYQVGSSIASLEIKTRATNAPTSSSVTMTIATENYGEFTFTVNISLTGYTISYNLDGGSVASANPTAYSSETETFTLTNPTKVGYTFKGWSGTDLIGDENQSVTVTKGSTGDRIYTAHWTPNTYTVKFDANGGSGTMADQSFTYDAAQNLNANDFTYSNKYFNGWTDGQGNSYTDGQSVSNLTTAANGTVTLYAQWSDKPAQTITFDTSDRTATYGDGALEARTAAAVGAITYSSSNTDVATVDENGVVTVWKTGEVTITASAAETDEYAVTSASYKLTIAPKALTITVADKFAYAGTKAPDLSKAESGKDYTVSGLVGSETVTVALSYATEPDMNKAGEYEITADVIDTSGNYTFTVVNGKLKVSYYPVYVDPAYPPTVEDTEGGSTAVSDKTPEKGAKVTITTDPDKGYEVGEVTVTDSKGNIIEVIDNGDGTYSYIQPAGGVTIRVTYNAMGCPSREYADLDINAWYHEATDYVLGKGLMGGVGNGKFDPDGTTTRAMLVTILWRLEGCPVVNYLMQFEDVPAETWYTEAVRWAASEKIVEGWGAKFDPTGAITREQFATILWRYARYKGYDVSVGENTNILSYDDAFSISEYAIPAMQWACGAGLMRGDGVNLTPAANATRSQAAALLMRFCELDQ